ncbi:hypothetical protein ACFVYV_52150 [Streptomyces mirabilis]|uniref:hypothetical protein n=1 Tax=Streptomyces mirabilis TaxID=68239 RepID=UPI0036DDB3EB
MIEESREFARQPGWWTFGPITSVTREQGDGSEHLAGKEVLQDRAPLAVGPGEQLGAPGLNTSKTIR